MGSRHSARLATTFAAATVITLGAVIAAVPASAADVIAADTESTIAAAPTVPASVPRAVASRPGAITVSNHGRHSVTLFAKGERIRRVLAPGARPVTFTGLTAGRTYTVAIGGEPIGAVVALNRPSAAAGLTVSTTGDPGTVVLTWRHRATTATGGRLIRYDIVATSRTSPRITGRAVGARSATLAGLDPDAKYSFTVTPRNSAGAGRSTRATMSRSLAQVTGTRPGAPNPSAVPAPGGESSPVVPVTPVPTAAPTPAPAPAPAAAPAPSPAPAPGPTTKTIYVCPDGFTETAGQCTMLMAYTYHREVETSPYAYHQEQQLNTISVAATFDGTVWTWSCPSGYSAGGGQWGVGICKGTVTANVKDAPPTGWYDTGSSYGHDIEVKDPMPSGYLDDGTQWVKTAAKESRVVPA